MNTMRSQRCILMVGNFLSPVRRTRGYCEDLAEHLAQNGWEIITTSSKNRRLPRLLDMLSTTWHNRRAYALTQVDVFSGSAFLWAEAVCTLLRWLGKPYILTLHGGNLPIFAKRWPGRMLRLLNTANAVTVPSAFLLEQMRNYHSDLRLIPNALDLSSFEFRQRKNIRPRLIWVRAFHKIYNPSLAPKVVHLLEDQFKDTRLFMVGPDMGDGTLQDAKNTTASLGVSEQISFVGAVPRSQVHQWLAEGDIFINTTNIDNAPISVIEAMACGLPVVSTNVGGIPYLLADGLDALLVPPDNPNAMATAIRRLLKDTKITSEISNNARQRATQFDWPIILPQWESLIEEVLLDF